MTQESRTSERAVIRSQLDVLSIAEGFLDSSVLFALVKLRVFEALGEGQRSLDELAAELHAPRDTLANPDGHILCEHFGCRRTVEYRFRECNDPLEYRHHVYFFG